LERKEKKGKRWERGKKASSTEAKKRRAKEKAEKNGKIRKQDNRRVRTQYPNFYYRKVYIKSEVS